MTGRRVATALALALALGGCGANAGNGATVRHEHNAWTLPGHLRIGMSDEPDNLNPMFAHTDATDQIDALIFAPVFR